MTASHHHVMVLVSVQKRSDGSQDFPHFYQSSHIRSTLEGDLILSQCPQRRRLMDVVRVEVFLHIFTTYKIQLQYPSGILASKYGHDSTPFNTKPCHRPLPKSSRNAGFWVSSTKSSPACESQQVNPAMAGCEDLRKRRNQP